MQATQFPVLSNISQPTGTSQSDTLEPPVEIWRYFLLPALLHVPLVLVLRSFSSLGAVYVLLLLIIGLYQLRKEKPDALILVCGYISSAELIWRMTNAPVFWETGKYLLALLLGLGILRWKKKLAMKPLLYLTVLVPSAIISLSAMSWGTVREHLSFNLSGPILLSVAALFFSGLQISRQSFNRLMLLGTVPIIGVWALAVRTMLLSDSIQFLNYSNFTTSGGYGPNQVSALLGLGVLFCWIYIFNARPTGFRWALMFGISLGLMAQAILTFSRGGVFNLAFAIPAATYFFTRHQKRTQRFVLGTMAVLIIALAFLIPNLNQFTGGSLATRYEDFNMTNREAIMESDLELWRRNLVFGVGVGVSTLMRNEMLSISATSHTEYTRLLAEHGLFGLVALFLLISMSWQVFHQAKGNLAKGSVLGFVLWVLAEMVHSAMRIAAISFVFAIPFAHLDLEE